MGNWYAGTETSDTPVGERLRVADEDAGMETGDAQVGGRKYLVAMADIGKYGRAREYT